MMQDNRLWILMSRFLSKEATSAEAEELHRLLAEAPDKQFFLEMLHAYFTPSEAVQAREHTGEEHLDEKFLQILEKSAVAPPRHLIRRRLAVAAVLIPLLAFGIYLLVRPGPVRLALEPNLQKSGEILSKAGARTKLVLPDGTRVWLNSSSKLRYMRPGGPGAGMSREVELEGEAYFDVAKDVQHPFVVHVDSLDIRVLGTAFTIKSYPQDQTIEATLLNGGIEVARKGNPDAPKVILRPNEKLVFNKRLSPAVVTRVSTGARASVATSEIVINSISRNIPDSEKVETAWMYNRLVLDGDNFSQAAAKMERWYNVKIVIRDAQLMGYRFGGTFANETVEQALKALQMTVPFKYDMKDNQIELYVK